MQTLNIKELAALCFDHVLVEGKFENVRYIDCIQFYAVDQTVRMRMTMLWQAPVRHDAHSHASGKIGAVQQVIVNEAIRYNT